MNNIKKTQYNLSSIGDWESLMQVRKLNLAFSKNVNLPDKKKFAACVYKKKIP